MLVLTVDTSTSYVVAGVVEISAPPVGGGFHSVGDAIAERATQIDDNPRGHMELLTPNIVRCLESAGLTPDDLEAVVVGIGPGPFTGLRVGMATGSAFGDALGIPVHGVPSLAAIAATELIAGRWEGSTELCVVTDARRREWYWGSYEWRHHMLVEKRPPAVNTPADVAETWNAEGEVAAAKAIAEQVGERTTDAISLDAMPSPAGLALAAMTLVEGREVAAARTMGAHSRTPQAAVAAALDRLAAPGLPLRALYLRRPDAVEPKRKERSSAVDFTAWDSARAEAADEGVAPGSQPEVVALTGDDAAELADLERVLFADESPWSADVFRSAITAPHTTYLGLVLPDTSARGRIVGYAGLAKNGPSRDPEWEIHTIGLLPAYQGRGWSHLLMEAMLTTVDAIGGPLFLEVRTDNEAAIGLYRRYDFDIVGTRKNYYQPSGADAFTMKRPSMAAPRLSAHAGSPGESAPSEDSMLIMGVESSCDETGVGIVELSLPTTDEERQSPRIVQRANRVASSMEEHARFGGVVPEIASRAHLEAMGPTMRAALKDVRGRRPDAIAATVGPGLAGALLVGAAAAKAYAAAWQVPFYGVNHLGGHVAVETLVEGDGPAKPVEHAIALLVSGGHTQILEVSGKDLAMRELGSTLDDAAGEAYDKVARLLGLGYPGGPIIDALAAKGNPAAIAFPRGMMRPKDARYDFSFSGLKTAVARYVERAERDGETVPIEDVCASFQEAVADVLTAKALRACNDVGAKVLLLGGGVSANGRLRELAARRCEEAGVDLRIPAPALCTDNGVMMATLAAQLIARGVKPSGLEVGTDPGLEVEEASV